MTNGVPGLNKWSQVGLFVWRSIIFVVHILLVTKELDRGPTLPYPV